MPGKKFALVIIIALFNASASWAQEATDQSVVELATQLSKEGYQGFTLEGDWLGRKFLVGRKDSEQLRIRLDKSGQPIDADFFEDRDGDGKFEKTLSDEKLEGIQQAERVISRLPVSDEIKTKILSKLEKAKNSASKSSTANEKSGAQIERDLEGKLKADTNNKPKDKLKPGNSAKLIDKQKPNNDKGKPKKR